MGLLVNPYSVTPAATKLLDLYPGAAGAYSVRKLRTAYTGSAMRVRRSSDNAEQDIGFKANGDLDTDAIYSFGGFNSLYVSKWYDQSENARDATQTSLGLQPRMMDAGSLEYFKSIPSPRYIATNNAFSCNSLATALSGEDRPISLFFVGISYMSDGTVAFDPVYFSSTSTSAVYSPIRAIDGNQTLQYRHIDDVGSGAFFTSGNPGDWSWLSYKLWQMIDTGLSVQVDNMTYGATAGGSYNIGASTYNRGLFGNVLGNFPEIIIYPSNQTVNRTGIRTNIMSYYGLP